MISHKHKCIFVHIPKVAGISIEQIFLEDLGLSFEDRMPLLLGFSTNKKMGPPRVSHLIAREYVEQHYVSQEIYDDYFTFGFVRNPYKRTYSFYKYLGYNKLISFETFILKYLELLLGDASLYYFMQPMYNYLYIDGELAVNRIGKLETINEDIQFVFQKTSIEERPVPHVNQSESLTLKAHVKLVYRILKKFPNILINLNFLSKNTEYHMTSEMKNKVVKLYHIDFEAFSYSKD